MSKSMKNNGLVQILDLVIPLFRLNFQVVTEAVNIYQEKMGSISTRIDTFSIPPEKYTDYFPRCENLLDIIINKLSEFIHDENIIAVKLMDILIVLTIFTKGSVKDKCKMLFGFFALSETQGLLENEHTTMLTRTMNCFKKLGFLKTLDFTEDDARHIAFLARIKEDGKSFHLSLSFQDFFLWVSNSSQANSIFKSVRLLNRLMEICISLDNKASSVTDLLNDITSQSRGVGEIRNIDLTTKLLMSYTPAVIYRSHCNVSFVVPRTTEYNDHVNYFVKIEQLNPVSYPLYSRAKRLAETYRAHNSSFEKSNAKKHKYYSKVRYVQLQVPLDSSFARLDIKDLIPSQIYHFTVCTEKVKCAPIKVTTLCLPPALPEKQVEST